MIDNAVKIGLETLGIGMLIVIGILTILMAALYLLIPIFRKLGSGGKKKKAETERAAVAPALNAVCDDMDESETVAAIMAAISAMTGKAPSTLKVVSFKRIK